MALVGLTTVILVSLSATSGFWLRQEYPFEETRASVRNLVVPFFEWFGHLASFTVRVFRAILTPPFEWRELMRQLNAIGPNSIPLVALAGGATGVVMALQMHDSLTRMGAKALLPSVILFSMIKETGPIITALVVSGRVGAGIGAELGSMRVTEQIDAMEVSAVDPYKYLAGTRVLACILMLPLLTVAADACGILAGWAAETLAEPISLRFFFETGFRHATFNDLLPPTLKTAVFGLVIGIIATFQGMHTQGGTEGVGRAATSSVVLGSLFVILADVLLVRLILVFFP